ncbi:MAG: histidine kinase [Owenweeksia sp.]|nr:histidine kinase [Owenweeksia sp.]
MHLKHTFKIASGLVLLLIFSATSEAQRYTFQKIGLEQGIPSARINDFLEDSRGFFWLATEGAGLVRYDGFQFKTYSLGRKGIKPIVTALAEDLRGHLWLAAENALLRYDGHTYQYYYLPMRQERILNITFSEEGSPLVAVANGVYQVGQGDTLKALRLKHGGRIKDIAWYKNQLWRATVEGLYRGDKLVKPGKWNSLEMSDEKLYAQGSQMLWQVGVKEFSEEFRGEYFGLRGDQQLALRSDSLILQSGQQSRILTRDNGLPEQDFKGCYVDRSGVVWLYSNAGLTKLPGMAFQLYTEMEGEVMAVNKVGNRLLAGTDQGLYIVEEGQVRKAAQADFRYGVVLALAHFAGNTWLGTESGLVRYNGQSFQPVSLSNSIGDFIFALKATDEALWIGTGSGIYKYKNGRTVNVSRMQNLPQASVYAISEGADGSLWFATYTQGFFRYDAGQWENLREMGGMRLDSLRFSSFAVVDRNELWLGTLSEGIFHIKGDENESISPAQLSFAETRSMAAAADGKMWIGTNKGVYRIEKIGDAYQIRFLNQSRQLLQAGCSPQAIDLEDGVLLAGTGNGLLKIDVEKLQSERPAPLLALTDLELFFGEVTGLANFADDSAAFTQVPLHLKLPYDLNYLSFTLAGLSGYEPQDLIYRYRINSDENWTQAGTRREAVYSNLPPGSYEFQAQVARPGEEWVPVSLSYRFSIKPPLWQQWWFITLVVVLLSGLTYWYLRQRIARVNQRIHLEKELLEMERKALRLQMNPHFIFNALDSISSFIFKKDPEQAVRYLNNFAKLMRLTLESSMEHLHPVETEVSILKNYLELEKLRFQGQLNYRIEVDDEIDYDVGNSAHAHSAARRKCYLTRYKTQGGRGISGDTL